MIYHSLLADAYHGIVPSLNNISKKGMLGSASQGG